MLLHAICITFELGFLKVYYRLAKTSKHEYIDKKNGLFSITKSLLLLFHNESL